MSHKNVPEVVSTFSQSCMLFSCFPPSSHAMWTLWEKNVCKCNKSHRWVFHYKTSWYILIEWSCSLVLTPVPNRLKTKDRKEHSGEYSCTTRGNLQLCNRVMSWEMLKQRADKIPLSLLPSRRTRRRPSRKEDEWLNIANHRDRKRLKVSQNANRKLWRMKQIMDSGEIVFGSLFCSVLIMPDVAEFGLPPRRQPRHGLDSLLLKVHRRGGKYTELSLINVLGVIWVTQSKCIVIRVSPCDLQFMHEAFDAHPSRDTLKSALGVKRSLSLSVLHEDEWKLEPFYRTCPSSLLTFGK